MSRVLGTRTVLSGSVSKGKGNGNLTLQMMGRPLMTPDELKSIPKGKFIVMKTGTHPMRTRLRLFKDWGIEFEEGFAVPEREQRKVFYASRNELLHNINEKFHLYVRPPAAASQKDNDKNDRKPDQPAENDQPIKTGEGV